MGFLASTILLGLLLGARRWWGALSAAVLAIPLVATLAFAGDVYGGVLRRLDRHVFTLDGLGFITRDHGGDRVLVEWLRAQSPAAHLLLVEAASQSYDNGGRLSAMTGVPAYLGWAGHEWLWRGDYTLPFKRRDEIAAFYQEPDLAKACQFVLEHGITHVALGKIERDFYPNLAAETLRQLGTAVAESGQSALIEVNPARCDPSAAS